MSGSAPPRRERLLPGQARAGSQGKPPRAGTALSSALGMGARSFPSWAVPQFGASLSHPRLCSLLCRLGRSSGQCPQHPGRCEHPLEKCGVRCCSGSWQRPQGQGEQQGWAGWLDGLGASLQRRWEQPRASCISCQRPAHACPRLTGLETCAGTGSVPRLGSAGCPCPHRATEGFGMHLLHLGHPGVMVQLSPCAGAGALPFALPAASPQPRSGSSSEQGLPQTPAWG